jgi:hypothetical protein
MKLMRSRLGVAAAGCALGVLCLFGCEAIDHVSARVDGRVVRFVDCQSSSTPLKKSINRVEVYADPLTASTSFDGPKWIVASDQPLQTRAAITYGIPPAQFKTIQGPAKIDPQTSSLEADFIHVQGTRDLSGETGDFDGSKLVQHKWLRWNGDVAATPCDG